MRVAFAIYSEPADPIGDLLRGVTVTRHACGTGLANARGPTSSSLSGSGHSRLAASDGSRGLAQRRPVLYLGGRMVTSQRTTPS